MRICMSQRDDDLRKIAIRYYSIYDDDGSIDEGRVERVLNKLRAVNTGLTDPITRGTRINLPAVKGVYDVPASDVRRLPRLLTFGVYVLVWLIPVLIFSALGIVWSLLQPTGADAASGVSRQAMLVYVTAQFAKLGLPPDQVWVNTLAVNVTTEVYQRIIACTRTAADLLAYHLEDWTIAVVLLWIFRWRSRYAPHVERRRKCVILWIFGIVLLLPWFRDSLQWLAARTVPDLELAVGSFSLIIAWTIVIAILFFYWNNEPSETFAQYVRRYRSIWSAFIVAIGVSLIIGYTVHITVDRRVDALLAVQTQLKELLADVDTKVKVARNDADRLDDQIGRYRQAANAYADSVQAPESDATEPSDEVPSEDGQGALTAKAAQAARAERNRFRASLKAQTDAAWFSAVASLGSVRRSGNALRSSGQSAKDQIDGLLGEQTQAETTPGLSITVLRPMISNVALALDGVSEKLDQLDAAATREEGVPDTLFDDTQKSLLEYKGAVDRLGGARRVATALDALGVATIGTYVWVGIFYGMFVLLPWALVLLFLFRKRFARAAQIRADLLRLDPAGGLLRRLLSTIDQRGQLGSSGARQDPTGDAAAQREIEELLAERAFSSFGYLASITLMTVLVAAGWNFVFYPSGSAGLAALLRDGGGIGRLTEYLTADLTTVTAGFIGAYFYVLQMLLRRYFADDLYPTVFIQATVRLLTVFILSLILAILPMDWQPKVPILLAFVAGIFPRSVLDFITRSVNRLTKIGVGSIEPSPLIQLHGLSIWNESRLLEENIENVQAMATAPIEQLVLWTHFPTAQLIDWLDQALLYAHAGHEGEWFPHLRAVGIRTGSNLLCAAGLESSGRSWLCGERFTPKPEALNRIVTAIHAAQARPERPAAVSASGVITAAEAAAASSAAQSGRQITTEILHEMCEMIWTEQNLQYVLNFRCAEVDPSAPCAPPAGPTNNGHATTQNGALPVDRHQRSRATATASPLFHFLPTLRTLFGL